MKSLLKKNQKGMALFLAMMLLSLGSSIAMITFQSSALDLEIARYAEYESASQYLAESGVDKVLSWATNPASSPNPLFFQNLPTTQCTGKRAEEDKDNPPNLLLETSDLTQPSGPFSELISMGRIERIQIYAPLNSADPQHLCTVEVTAVSGKGARKVHRVELTSNPMGTITAGIQGTGNPNSPSPVWVHWGDVRYTGDANLGDDIARVPILEPGLSPDGNAYSPGNFEANRDPWMELHVEKNVVNPVSSTTEGPAFPFRSNVHPNDDSAHVVLDRVEPDRLKSFIQKHGEIYTVSSEGTLLRQGVDRGSFDEAFGQTQEYRLVWIETDQDSTSDPLLVDGGRYRGYFYITGSIRIQGNLPGQTVEAFSPPKNGAPMSVNLEDINLDGLFYVKGEVEVQGPFKAYGALYAGGGFKGDHTQDLEVWYNNDFRRSNFKDVRRVTPIDGSWSLASPR